MTKNVYYNKKEDKNQFISTINEQRYIQVHQNTTSSDGSIQKRLIAHPLSHHIDIRRTIQYSKHFSHIYARFLRLIRG